MSLHQYDCYTQPIEVSLDSVFAESRFTTLLACGIVNPFGPTFEALLAEGDVTNAFTIYRLMLNPFRQQFLKAGEGTGIGLVNEPGNYIESECLAEFFKSLGPCPTLLFDVPAFIPDDESRQLYLREFLKGRQGASDVLAGLRRHPFDPWTRVQEEMENFDPSRPWNSHEPRELSDLEAQELLTRLLDENHMRPELEAFLYAWTGSISLQREHGSQSMARDAMDAVQFLRFLEVVESGCTAQTQN